MLPLGSKTPSFSVKNQVGEVVTDQDFLGHWVVLYFYPRDETPGCTVQACSFRDNAEALKKMGVTVYGVSKDSVKSHQKFIANHTLPFSLLSDTNHAVAEAFQVWVEKSMFGKAYFGMDRSTYILSPDGKVAAAFSKVNPLNHGAVVAAEIKRLTA
ncbi:thioredoxin-dependent thiol peroxidase [soil metagenome]